jgi:hypothetical protein
MSDREWSSGPDATNMGGYGIYATKNTVIIVYVNRWHTPSTMRKTAIALLQAADYADDQEQK